ncbi:MAG: hypothetical protein ACYC2T_00395 [Bacillota bacterium]
MPPMVSGNLFQMDCEHREALQVASLPRNLEEALQELAADQVIRDTLGGLPLPVVYRCKDSGMGAFPDLCTPLGAKRIPSSTLASINIQNITGGSNYFR